MFPRSFISSNFSRWKEKNTLKQLPPHPTNPRFNFLKKRQLTDRAIHICNDSIWGNNRLKLGARSIQPKFQLVRPGKVVHLKRWTRFFETFPFGPNWSIEFWTEISGNFGWMDRALDSMDTFVSIVKQPLVDSPGLQIERTVPSTKAKQLLSRAPFRWTTSANLSRLAWLSCWWFYWRMWWLWAW